MQSLRRLAITLALLAIMPLALADFEAGQDYKQIQPAQTPAVDEGEVEVVELFWYGCPHCYSLEPHISAWEKGLADDVSFQRVPAVLNPQWAEHARVFYTAEALDMVGDIHRPLFQGIHEEGRQLNSPGALQEFLVEHGADPEAVEETYDSFGVSSRVRRAQEVGAAYGVDHVPSVAINGKYWTSPSVAGSQRRFFQVVEHLIERERE